MRRTGFMIALVALAGCAQTPSNAIAEPQSRAEGQPAALEAVSPNDVSCMAEAIYFEARGTGDQGIRAVGHVVRNRAESDEFPNSVCAVVDEKCQFSYRCDGEPEEFSNATARARALKAARLVLSGAPDITGGALFFHSDGVDPGWFSTRKRMGTFGRNVFYQ